MTDPQTPPGWTSPDQAPAPSAASPAPKKPWYRRKVGIAAIAVVVLVALGAAAGGGGSKEPSESTGSPTEAPAAATDAATDAATTPPEATQAQVEGEGPAQYAIGEPAVVDGLQVTVLESSYSRGEQFQKPADGSVYVAYKIEVKALEGDQFISTSSFTVATDDGKQGQFAIVMNDEWEPSLVLDEVKEGNSLTGWMTFEVPEPAANVVLSFTANMFSDTVDATWVMACCKK